MPQQLINLALSAPGFYGLNKQQSGDVLPTGWATEAKNAVFDTVGRIAARNGGKHTSATGFTGDPGSAHEYIDGDGNRVVIFGADNKIYKIDGTSYTDISGTITTPTADNWQFANFNGKCVGFQASHTPILISTTGGSFADLTGTNIPTADNVLSAFGRLWVIDGTSLTYSELLNEADFGAGPNSVDLSTVFWRGMDEGVVCAEWNEYLCIFGMRSIAIYQGATDPAGADFGLVENISEIGCIARDSIQAIGTDIMFLSFTGVRSLQRTIQEKSQPLNDISKNNRDYVLSFYNSAQVVKSTYCEKERFYLLSFPSQSKVICFDTQFPLEDGSLRMTEWDADHFCYAATYDTTLYIGVNQFIDTYEGYLDSVLSDGTGGSTYPWNFESGWANLAQETENRLKIPKRGSVHFLGNFNGTIIYKLGFDYQNSFRSYPLVITTQQLGSEEWGIMEWGLGEWSGSDYFNEAKTNLSGNGRIIKLGVSVTVNNQEFALQRIDMQAKLGKTLT